MDRTFALVGALVFAILVAPVMGGIAFAKGAKEWENPMMKWLTDRYRVSVRSAILHRNLTFGIAMVLFAVAIYLSFGGPIGSEFLPHLDEGPSGCAEHCLQARAPRRASTSPIRRGLSWPRFLK